METTIKTQTLRERAIPIVGACIGIFIFYTSFFGTFETLIQRSLFVALIVILGVMLHPLGHGAKWRPLGLFVDLLIVLAVLTGVGYILVNFETIMNDLPFAEQIDVWIGGLALIGILELSRRCASPVFPILVSIALAYAYFGEYISGAMGHRGFDMYYLTEVIYLSDRGMWGMLVNIASTTLASFILFGSFLLHTGAGQTFLDMSSRISGSSVGGAAKIATIASGLFGSISGSSVANVATTGNFTIPLMKRLKYPSAFSGAVEAMASTGGQLAPPIMGTAAFVMAELVGVNYWAIITIAFIPAVLLYFGIFNTVHLISKKSDFGKVDDSELPDWRESLVWHRITPIVCAFGGIILGVINGYSINMTACLGIIGNVGAFIICSLLQKAPLGSIVEKLKAALIDGGKGVVVVGILLVAAQVFVAMVNLTGVGVTITNIILDFANGDVLMIAILMAVVCLIAGMGLPTSAAYVLVSAVFAPALIQQGFAPVTVHLFVLYYAALSVITPPVCISVFVAAAISQDPWHKVAGYTLRLGGTAYLLPLLFLFNPGLLLEGSMSSIIMIVVFTVLQVMALSSLMAAYPVTSHKYSWLFWLIPAAAMFSPLLWVKAAAAATVIMMVYVSNQNLSKNQGLTPSH
ncbi:TRAP transporter fused permease subunit [Photobacterium rosenbergii]|uniref:TRAP transporter fused permease subunit n=1 Tax=Photobacterium rosenbergii TaxID=294936 RepID=A0ABU3ZIG0_9GAMM|nr:TRAP transporter fused permease subunit [Photobacterium rosenbergii]MDV5169920.1 TRAP transporter fused permease subunit [Photobacterium rosenbergii]